MTHGAADATSATAAWHGPHESPRAMTVPLMALAVGAVFAGFIGVPAALGGSNAFERFLEPSLASLTHGTAVTVTLTRHTEAAPADSHGVEWALMRCRRSCRRRDPARAAFLPGKPEIPARLARSWPAAYALLMNKYYVDEAYDATIVRGTMAAAAASGVRSRHCRRRRQRYPGG